MEFESWERIIYYFDVGGLEELSQCIGDCALKRKMRGRPTSFEEAQSR